MINILKSIIKRLSFYTYITLLIIVLLSLFSVKPWKNSEQDQALINWDIISDYSYLPAIFIHNDIQLKFTNNDTIDYEENRQFWPEIAPNNGKVIKTTMGMSILYSPFFIIGHTYSKLSNQHKSNGFSKPYEFFLALSCIFYLMIGLYYLRKILLTIFNELETSIILTIIILGTNLFYYLTVEPCMSHAYNFSLIAIFLYFTIRWFKNPQFKFAVILGFIAGLIILIRPVNILILIFPLLYQINHFKKTISKICNYWQHILLAGLIVFCVSFPQLLYWKTITGDWIFNSYIGERFYFNNPHIIEFLFSYRNGWLLYSPIMSFAIFGIILNYFKQKEYFFSLIIFTLLNIYILSSWWCWWYGGSFGMRTMIDSYAILAIPLGATVKWVLKQKKPIKYTFLIIMFSLIYLNNFQIKQRKNSLIHFDSMTKEAYWMNFGKKYMKSESEWKLFEQKLQSPNYEKAKKGID